MSVESVPGRPSIYAVETPLLGVPETCTAYVVDGPDPAIVDTGPANAVQRIFDGLAALDIPLENVAYIVPTHAHLDHAGGAGHLADACPNATVVCHPAAVDVLADEQSLARLTDSVERAIGVERPFGEPRVIDRERVRVAGAGETIDPAGRPLDVIDAPGHAPHQFCLYDRETRALFAADAAGMHFPDVGHRPTTSPPDFDLEAALETIDRLLEYEPETLLYSHVGAGEPSGAMEELRRYREMLPAYVDRIADLRDDHGEDVAAIAEEMADEWGHWSLRIDVAGVLEYLE